MHRVCQALQSALGQKDLGEREFHMTSDGVRAMPSLQVVDAVDAVARLRSVDFVERSSARASTLQRVIRALYTLAKHEEETELGPLLELTVEGFDDEGVWQQLDLRNAPLLTFVGDKLAGVGGRERALDQHLSKEAAEEAAEEDDDRVDAEGEGEDEGEEDEEDEDEEDEEEGGGEQGEGRVGEEGVDSDAKESDEEGEDDEDDDGKEETAAAIRTKGASKRESGGDEDAWEKMAREMDEFAEQAENGEEGEEGMDELYGGLGEGEESEEGEDEDEEEGEEEEEEDEDEDEDEEDGEDEEDEDEVVDDEDESDPVLGDGNEANMSAHERATKLMQAKMAKLEEAQVVPHASLPY